MFSVKEPEISRQMVDEKVDSVLSTEAEVLISCDQACLMNIAGRFNRRGEKIKIMHLAEVLNSNVDPRGSLITLTTCWLQEVALMPIKTSDQPFTTRLKESEADKFMQRAVAKAQDAQWDKRTSFTRRPRQLATVARTRRTDPPTCDPLFARLLGTLQR
jgi:hypothetical protein